MEGMFEEDAVPCSSLAVDSFIRIGVAGATWGVFFGPYEADRKGLIGSARSYFALKLVGKYGLQCGLAACAFSATRCGIQRYRMQRDWLNTSIAGAIIGAALAMRTRSLTQVFGTAAVVSAIATAADYSAI